MNISRLALVAMLISIVCCTAEVESNLAPTVEAVATGANDASAPSAAASNEARAGEAVAQPSARLTPEQCELGCENLIRITLSELGELAFRLPPDALSRPRNNCLEACAKAESEEDVAKMQCLILSQAASTGELTEECKLDLQTKPSP
jgi:hypothetical protein